MPSFIARAGRWPLALMLAALGVSADGEPLSAASSTPSRPNLAVGDVIMVTNAKGGTDVGSLRWAVAQATGGEIIRFDSRLAGSTITLDSTLLIRNYVTIEGPADKGVTISGGGKGRVIDVTTTTLNQPPTTLRNLSITGGKVVTGGGGGIRTATALVLEHSTVWGNEAIGAAAILAFSYGRLTLVNSTVSGNLSRGYGYAAIIAAEGLTLDNSTVAYNSQGGIHVAELGTTVLRSSIIASNGRSNCFHSEFVTYEGRNLSNDRSCGDSTVMLIGDAKLESLRDNGGPAMTHALAPESPAFNQGAFCSLQVDQRYTARDAQCDIGAYESTDPNGGHHHHRAARGR